MGFFLFASIVAGPELVANTFCRVNLGEAVKASLWPIATSFLPAQAQDRPLSSQEEIHWTLIIGDQTSSEN